MNRATPTTSTPSHERRRQRHNNDWLLHRYDSSRQPRRGVRFLRWPHEEEKRYQFIELRIPVLWIVESTYAPPEWIDPLEDWIRLPMASQDIDARIACIAQRARDEIVPVIRPDNVLCTRDARLPLADSEAAIMASLVENFQRVVPRMALVERGWGKASDQYRNALDLRILRLRRRITPLALEIKTVWGRGYMLEAA